MDIDPKDMLSQAETARNEREARGARLNAAVAVTIALLATFMGICKVKDDNIVHDIVEDAKGHDVSASGWGHPEVDAKEKAIAAALPVTHPKGPNP